MNYDYTLEFTTLWTMTYAIGPFMDLFGLLWVFETQLDLFETIYGHTYALEYLCLDIGLWTLDLITPLITLINLNHKYLS